MSEEEMKAIERLNKRYEFFKENPLATNVWLTLDIHNLGIVLNLIEKQEKVIDEMAKTVYDYANLGTMGICPAEIENGCINFDLCEYFGKKDINCLKCIKQYYYRKVENNE